MWLYLGLRLVLLKRYLRLLLLLLLLLLWLYLGLRLVLLRRYLRLRLLHLLLRLYLKLLPQLLLLLLQYLTPRYWFQHCMLRHLRLLYLCRRYCWACLH